MMNRVIVSNIPTSASTESITEFFSFCGEVLAVRLEAADSASLRGEVVFASPDAVSTAVLLNGSLLTDRPLIVEANEVKADESKAETKADESKAETPEEQGRDSMVVDPFPAQATPAAGPHPTAPEVAMRSRQAIVALIAAGYSVGSRALEYVKDYDEKRQVSVQVRTAVEQAVTTAKKVDAERAGGAGVRALECGLGFVHATLNKGQELANEHIDPLATSAVSKGQQCVATALEHPKVAAALQHPKVTAGWAATKCTLLAAKGWASATLDEAKARIAHEQAQRTSEREEEARVAAAANFSIEEPTPQMEPPPPAYAVASAA